MTTPNRPRGGGPEGLWKRCPECKATIFRKEAERLFNVCPECGYHFYLPAPERIARLWGMISDLDPELARRRSGYERPTDE